MTGQEIFIVYGFPAMLVAGGSLLAWRNHVVMRRAHLRDRDAAATSVGAPSVSRGEIEDVLREMHLGPSKVSGHMANVG